jgi:hypothetical protein
MKLNESKTQFNREQDYKFMDDRKHQNAARRLAEQIAREKCWSKEGFLNEMKRRGFLKTPQDRMIVLDVMSKMKFTSKGEFKERKKYEPKDLINKLSSPDIDPEEKQLEKYNPF